MSEETAIAEIEPTAEGQNSEPQAEQEVAEALESSNVEASASSEETAEETEGKQKLSGVQKRINELTRQRYEEEEKRKALEAEVQQLREQQFKTTHESGKPTLEQFDYDQDAYQEAVLKWAQDGVQREQEAKLQAEKERQEFQQQIQKAQALREKVTKAIEKYPDYLDVVENPDVPSLGKLNQAAYEALMESEAMADVSYYLAKNPHEVYEFQSMSPSQAIRKIVSIEQRFKKPKTSNAPPPPTSVGGKASATVDPSKMTTEEWMEWRRQSLQ